MKRKGISTLIGSSLLHFMIGSQNTFGNLNTYITSYLRQNGSKDANYGQSVWYTAVGVTAFTVFTILSGFVVNKIGTKYTCFVATFVLCGSIALTSMALNYTFIIVLTTFGLIQNIGNGLMYSTIIVNAIKWFPDYKGLVSGVITGANAFSVFVFTQIQTFYLNPNNVKPNSEGYFDETDLLSRVPQLFVILSVIYGVIGFIAICLIFDFKEPVNNNTIECQPNERHVFDDCQHIVLTADTSDKAVPIGKAMKTRFFYILLTTFALSTQTVYFMNGMIKAFGQSYISDDHFLAVILSLSSIFCALGGVFWGKILDILKFRDTIIAINACLSVLTFTLNISTFVYQKILYTIWTFGIFFTTVGVFSIYLPEVVRKFGDRNSLTIYGLIHVGPALLSLIVSPILEWALNTFGWFSAFCSVGALNSLSMVVIMVSYSSRG